MSPTKAIQLQNLNRSIPLSRAMLLLANRRDGQDHSAVMCAALGRQRLGTKTFGDETKPVVLQVSVCSYPVWLERRLLCDTEVRQTPSHSTALSVPEGTFCF